MEIKGVSDYFVKDVYGVKATYASFSNEQEVARVDKKAEPDYSYRVNPVMDATHPNDQHNPLREGVVFSQRQVARAYEDVMDSWLDKRSVDILR